MDHKRKSATELATAPAQLWVGNHEKLVEHAITFLQKQFCKNDGCMICSTCRQISQQQHHGSIWLCPEKQYTTDDLEIIFKTISFALDENQHCYFVIQKADYLTPVCANSLLKSLEEPPHGYHFLLLTTRLDALLPTIRSRCIITTFADSSSAPEHKILAYFTSYRMSDPLSFAQDIEKFAPSERETMELLDQLLTHWIGEYKKNIVSHDIQRMNYALTIIAYIKTMIQKPPMPGSSKLFWKNFFLQNH